MSLFAVFAWETHPIRAGQRLPVDSHGAERGVRGQTLVPLARSLLGDGLHEVPLQLTDAGMVLKDVFVGLFKFLRGWWCGGGGWTCRVVGVGKIASRVRKSIEWKEEGKKGENMGGGSMKDKIVFRKGRKRRKRSQIACYYFLMVFNVEVALDLNQL